MNLEFELTCREIRAVQSEFHKAGEKNFSYIFKRSNTAAEHEHSFNTFSFSFAEDKGWELGHKLRITVEA